MKRTLIRAYWLMLIAWSVFLNGYGLIGCVIGILASVMLAVRNGEVNYWRIFALSLVFYNTSAIVLYFSNIPLYFSNIYLFMNVVCINAAFVNEYLYLLKKRFILPIIYMLLLGIFIFAAAILIVPGELYTVFTKLSLFKVMGFIFLPYLLPLLVCIAIRSVDPKILIHKRLVSHKAGHISKTVTLR